MSSFYPVAPLPDNNSRQISTPIRMPSTALLTIDSEDRYTDYSGATIKQSSPYDFTISKRESLMNGFITRVGISEVVFPWLIPNINAKSRQILYSYNAGAGVVNNILITLPIGFYRPSQLASAIQSIVALNIPTFTMTYSAAGQPLFRYDTGGATTIAFNQLPYNSSAYPYGPTAKQLFYVLGFNSVNTILTPVQLGGYTLCQSIRYVDICSYQMTNQQSLKDQTSQVIARDMLCRVYLGDGGGGGQSTVGCSDPSFCPPGCAPMTIYRNYTVPKNIQWIPGQPISGFLRFQVYDDAGELINESLSSTTYSADWSMTMLCSEN